MAKRRKHILLFVFQVAATPIRCYDDGLSPLWTGQENVMMWMVHMILWCVQCFFVPAVVVLAMVGAVRLASCEGGEVLGPETYIEMKYIYTNFIIYYYTLTSDIWLQGYSSWAGYP